MKKTETYTKDVYYCDVCGKKIEHNVVNPYVVVRYQSIIESNKSSKLYDDSIEFNSNLDLCGYHSRCLSNIILNKLSETLSFLNDNSKVEDLIKKEEVGK